MSATSWSRSRPRSTDRSWSHSRPRSKNRSRSHSGSSWSRGESKGRRSKSPGRNRYKRSSAERAREKSGPSNSRKDVPTETSEDPNAIIAVILGYLIGFYYDQFGYFRLGETYEKRVARAF